MRWSRRISPRRCSIVSFAATGFSNACCPPAGRVDRELASGGGDQRQFAAEEFQRFGKALRHPQPLAPGHHRILRNAGSRWRRLDDRVGGAFMGVAEHGKQRQPIPVIDRVVAPDTARNIPAIEAEKLVELESREVEGPPPRRPKILEKQYRRTLPAHRRPSLLVPMTVF